MLVGRLAERWQVGQVAQPKQLQHRRRCHQQLVRIAADQTAVKQRLERTVAGRAADVLDA